MPIQLVLVIAFTSGKGFSALRSGSSTLDFQFLIQASTSLEILTSAINEEEAFVEHRFKFVLPRWRYR